MRDVLVVDHDEMAHGGATRCESNATAFVEAGSRTFQSDATGEYCFDSGSGRWDRVRLPREFDLVFVNDNHFVKWTALQRSTRQIVRYTGGDPDAIRDEPCVRRRAITAEHPLTKIEAADLLQWVDTDGASVCALLSPPRRLVLTALAVLCQGYLVLADDAVALGIAKERLGAIRKQIHQDVATLKNDIPWSWFAKPFGKEVSDVARDLRSEWGGDCDERVARMVSAMRDTPEAPADAKLVAEAYDAIRGRLQTK